VIDEKEQGRGCRKGERTRNPHLVKQRGKHLFKGHLRRRNKKTQGDITLYSANKRGKGNNLEKGFLR